MGWYFHFFSNHCMFNFLSNYFLYVGFLCLILLKMIKINKYENMKKWKKKMKLRRFHEKKNILYILKNKSIKRSCVKRHGEGVIKEGGKEKK